MAIDCQKDGPYVFAKKSTGIIWTRADSTEATRLTIREVERDLVRIVVPLDYRRSQIFVNLEILDAPQREILFAALFCRGMKIGATQSRKRHQCLLATASNSKRNN